MEQFSPEKFRKTRKILNLCGLLIPLGIYNLIFPDIPFPIPITGEPGICISIGMIISGVFCLYFGYYKLPDDRTVEQVAKIANGYITAAILIDQLGISHKMAESSIKTLFLNGYLAICNKVENTTQIAQWVTQYVGIGSKSFSGVICPRQSTGKSEEAINLGQLTADNPEMDVSEINNMILANTMNIGRSGQPMPPRKRSIRDRIGL